MKKKKILAGSLLGITVLAVGASLASCDLALTPTYEATRVTQTTIPAKPTGTTTPTTSQPTPTGTSTGGGTTTPTTPTTVQPVATYNVTYNTLGHGTAPEAVEGITKLPTTLPVVSDDGLYKFLGWSLTEGGTTLVEAGSTISADTTLYAVWQKTSLYDAIANSDSAIYATKFDDEVVSPILEYKVGYKGVYSISKQTEKLKVEVKDGKLVLTDTDATDPTIARVQMGLVYSGFVEGTVKINFKDTKQSANPSKQSLLTIYGFNNFKEELAVFALRSNTNGKLQILPGKENGDAAASYVGTELDWTQGTEFEVYWSYDFDTNKLNVSVDEKDILTDYELKAEYKPVLLTSAEFRTAGGSTTRSSQLDEFAVANAGTLDLAQTKTYFTSLVDKEIAKFDMTKYTINAEAMGAMFSFIKTTIEQSTTIEQGVNALYYLNLLYEFDDDVTYNAKLEAYKAEQTELLQELYEDLNSSYILESEKFAKLFNDAFDAIDEATSKSDIDDIVEKLSSNLETLMTDSEIKLAAAESIANYCSVLKAGAPEIEGISDDDLKDLIDLLDAKLAEVYQDILDVAPLNLDDETESAQKELYGIYNSYTKTLQENIAEFTTAFNAYKNLALNTLLIEEPTAIYQDYATQLSTLRQNINDAVLDFTNADTIAKARKEFENKVTAISEYVEEHNRIILVFKAQEDLKAEYETLKAKLVYDEAINSLQDDYLDLDAKLKLASIDEVDVTYDEIIDALNESFLKALQIELDARQDVEVSAFVDYKASWDVKVLAEALLQETDKHLAVKVYEGVFDLKSGTNVAKNDSGVITVSFKKTKIEFTTYYPNAVLTLTAPAEQTKRLIALDEDITSQAQQEAAWTNTDTVKYQGTTTTFTIATPGVHYITMDDTEHKLQKIELSDKKEEVVAAKLNKVTVTFSSEYGEGSNISTLIDKIEGEAYYDSNDDGVINNDDDKKTIELDKSKLDIIVLDQDTNVVAIESISDPTNNVNNLTASGSYDISIAYISSTEKATNKYNIFEADNVNITVDQTARYNVTFETFGGSSVTAQVVKDGDKAKKPETDPTLDDCVFAGWYSDAELTTEFDFNSEITVDTTIYAKWYDQFDLEKFYTSSIKFDSTYTTAPSGDNPLNIKDKNEVIEIFTNNGSDVWDATYKGLKFNGATKNSRYIKLSLSTKTLITIVATGGANNRYLEVSNNYGTATTTESDTCKSCPKSTMTTITFTLSEGVYYINSSGSCYIESISARETSKAGLAEIMSIGAEVEGNLGLIDISKVTLTDIESKEYELSSEQYDVYLNDANTPVSLTNGKINDLAAGTYKVTIKYGKFTVATYDNVVVTTDAFSQDTTIDLASDDFFTELAANQDTVQNTVAKIGNLTIDATSGKFAKNNASWSQFNGGAIISFRVLANTKVTVVGYSSKGISINGVYSVDTTFSRFFDEDTLVVVKALDPNGYIRSISIDVDATPIVESEEISSIVISGQTTEFENGATFALGNGAKFEVIYSDNLVRPVTIDLTNITFDDGVLANGKFDVEDEVVTATVTYEGKTTTYDVTVGTPGAVYIEQDTAIAFHQNSISGGIQWTKLDSNNNLTAGTQDGFTITGTNFSNSGYLEFKGDDAISFELKVPSGKNAVLSIAYYYETEGSLATVKIDNGNAINGVKQDILSSESKYVYSYELSSSGTVTITSVQNVQNYLNYIAIDFFDDDTSSNECKVAFNADDFSSNSASIGTKTYPTNSVVCANKDFILKTNTGQGADIVRDKSTAIYDSNTPFDYALVGSGTSSSSGGFILSPFYTGELKIYYTMTDSKFATDNQSKSGNLTYVIGSNSAVVSTNTAKKSNTVVYLETINVTTLDDINIYSSTNRIAIFKIELIHDADTRVETKLTSYDGKTNSTQTYWTISDKGNGQRISPTIGGNKDSDDAVNCYKFNTGEGIKSSKFENGTKKIHLKMLSSSTSTSSSINATVNLYAEDGTTIVKTFNWVNVTSGQKTCYSNIYIQADTNFYYVEVVYSGNVSGQNFGIYSLDASIFL